MLGKRNEIDNHSYKEHVKIVTDAKFVSEKLHVYEKYRAILVNFMIYFYLVL